MKGIYIALFAVSVLAFAPMTGQAQQKSEFFGTVKSVDGKTVTIELDQKDQVPLKMRAEAYTFFQKDIGKMKTSGWLLAAVGTIEKAKDRIVTFYAAEEKSKMTVNGKRVKHIKPGVKIKLKVLG